MKRTERELLKEELVELNDAFLALQSSTEDQEIRAEINNILTPIRYAMEDLLEPEGKSFARYVIEASSLRLPKIQQAVASTRQEVTDAIPEKTI